MLTIHQLTSVPYLDASVLQGRFVASLCFYDKGWRMWLQAGELGEQLIETTAIPAEACYFAAEAQSPNDICLPFLNFLAQRACMLSVQRAFSGLLDDLFNLSGSLAKIRLLECSSQTVPHGLSRMATTEVEYVVSVCRSLFDLHQEVVAKLWDSVFLYDRQAHRQKLKASFADMVTYRGEPCYAEQIARRFGLPANIAVCYERGREIFDGLKRLRDNLIHRGSQLPHIFVSEDTFLIAEKTNPLPHLNIWEADEYRPNQLVPLLPLLQTIIYRSFQVCEELSGAVQEVIQFPPPVVPGMHFFARGFFTANLVCALASGERRSTASRLAEQG